VRPELIPVLPMPKRLVFQAVHSLDVGEAYRLAAVGDARGPFNIAAEPVLDHGRLAQLLDARPLNVDARLLRAGAAATYRLRLQPSEPGWVDMGLAVPLMDTTRAREELGWNPTRGADEALLELLEGMRGRSGLDTPPLAANSGGPGRVRELLSGVGRRQGH
jgi:UDP-glucose 4-epimerase